jgi:hypothetical protein
MAITYPERGRSRIILSINISSLYPMMDIHPVGNSSFMPSFCNAFWFHFEPLTPPCRFPDEARTPGRAVAGLKKGFPGALPV